MKKNLKIVGVACASLLLLGGCGEIPTLENGEDAVVSFEGIDGISVNTLYENLKASYGIDALITLIDTQIYETEFPDDLEDATTSAQSQVDYYISYYGSEEDFEAQISSYYGTVDAFQQAMYVSYLQDIAINQYSKSLITDDQVEKYYDEEYYADVELSHILITSSASSTADEDEVTAAEEEAEELLLEIVALLNEAKANGEDIEEVFAQLAEEYSDDSATNTDGGSLGRINYEDYDYTYDELVDAAIALSDGEYSTTIIETELGFHIILKTETYEKDSLEDVEDSIIQTLSDNALAADNYIILDALEYYREKYGFSINDDELYEDYIAYMEELEAYIASLSE